MKKAMLVSVSREGLIDDLLAELVYRINLNIGSHFFGLVDEDLGTITDVEQIEVVRIIENAVKPSTVEAIVLYEVTCK